MEVVDRQQAVAEQLATQEEIAQLGPRVPLARWTRAPILQRRGVFTSVVGRAPAGVDALDADDRREISILLEAVAADIEVYPFGPE